MWTWGQALAYGVSELGGAEYTTDVLRLLTDKTDYNLLAVYELFDTELLNVNEFKQFVARRKLGEPVAYITERQDFWRSSFYVNNNVLIPRQDSELIVETLLELPTPASILELGVGSGAVLLSCLLELPAVKGFASDISQGALAVAKQNCQRHGCVVDFRLGSWLQPWVDTKFDIIIANPPYIADSDPCLQQLQYEPLSALVAKQHGLADLLTIINTAKQHLHSGGWLLLEHGFEQAEILEKNLSDWRLSYCLRDLNGHNRLTVAQAP